jgi:hypothetical protein
MTEIDTTLAVSARKNSTKWLERVAVCVAHERMLKLWEQKLSMWQVERADLRGGRELELVARRKKNQEMRQSRREEKQVEENRISVARREHGMQLWESLMLYAGEPVCLKLPGRRFEVIVNTAVHVPTTLRRQLRKIELDNFSLMREQLGYAPGYGKVYSSRSPRMHGQCMVADLRPVHDCTKARRVCAAPLKTHLRDMRASLPRRVVGSRWVACRRFLHARRSPGCGVNQEAYTIN